MSFEGFTFPDLSCIIRSRSVCLLDYLFGSFRFVTGFCFEAQERRQGVMAFEKYEKGLWTLVWL